MKKKKRRKKNSNKRSNDRIVVVELVVVETTKTTKVSAKVHTSKFDVRCCSITTTTTKDVLFISYHIILENKQELI